MPKEKAKKSLKTKLESSEGSFTLEASMVLPIVLLLTMLLLFFSLYSYQKSMLLQIASTVTERAAFNWDNSYKGKGGAVEPGRYDSLYWRIGEDGVLSSWFGIGAAEGRLKVPLPAAEGTEGLPGRKLKQSGGIVQGGITGEIGYQFEWSGRKVTSQLEKVLKLPPLDEMLADGAVPRVSAQSAVTEPAEFIRTVDLVRYYSAKFKTSRAKGQGVNRQDASAMLSKLGGPDKGKE
ncbi:TadE/TadG family type IV pilus assembly protein [Paenibacillus sp. CN-4]|uniref:TadE/TadG family type IV pilus assembly protein n=1 Tax=Paenibacillus nanchangensis TaxID=3348343 RepID=UPI00397C4FA5